MASRISRIVASFQMKHQSWCASTKTPFGVQKTKRAETGNLSLIPIPYCVTSMMHMTLTIISQGRQRGAVPCTSTVVKGRWRCTKWIIFMTHLLKCIKKPLIPTLPLVVTFLLRKYEENEKRGWRLAQV